MKEGIGEESTQEKRKKKKEKGKKRSRNPYLRGSFEGFVLKALTQ
jgi:hypothetical protein